MTAETKKAMKERNERICAFYAEGHSQAECMREFSLKRQRVQQILKRGGAWKRHEPSNRTKFLGVSVSDATKSRLEEKAEDAGVSVSKLASDALDQLVKG